MHITFVSLCQKKSLDRTRRVLDRYATRIGDKTWEARFTQEALEDVYKELRRRASRNTAVACYRNDGHSAVKCLWIVGSRRYFGANGAIAIRTVKAKPRAPRRHNLIPLVARTAGIMHDLGKATVHFQHKLKLAIDDPGNARVLGDKYRHEWVSAQVAFAIFSSPELDSETFEAHFDKGACKDLPLLAIETTNPGLLSGKTQRSLSSIQDCVLACVLTHHGLLHAGKNQGFVDHRNQVRDSDERFSEQDDETFRNLARSAGSDGEQSLKFGEETLRQIRQLRRRVCQKDDAPISEDADFFKGLTLVARAALIAADHQVSGWRYSGPAAKIGETFVANTRKEEDRYGNLSSNENQPLDYHLQEVARKAGEWGLFFENPDDGLPSIFSESRDRLLKLDSSSDFVWQNRLIDALSKIRKSEKGTGTLVFNLAGTGSGKTLANIKALAALTPPEQPLRFSIGLNLRTLTLQTADALIKAPACLSGSELKCLIGDRLVQRFHNSINTDEDDGSAISNNEDSGNASEIDYSEDLEYEPIIQSLGQSDRPVWAQDELPDFIAQWAASQRDSNNALSFIASPGLVSTTDYLIAAGDPAKQGHHVKACMRVASSDLILDEIESYSPDAMVAVARLVMLSALFNRNVIVSSATAGLPVIAAISQAYLCGQRMRQKLYGLNEAVSIVIADNHTPVSIQGLSPAPAVGKDDGSWIWGKNSPLPGLAREHIQALMEATKEEPKRQLAYVEPVARVSEGESKSELNKSAMGSLSDSILEATRKLHASHCWTDPQSGKKVSFGVVRVARIKTCIAVAKWLSELGENIYVTAYHANETRGKRMLKEAQFDRMFSRKSDPAAPVMDADIRRLIDSHPGDELIFVMVATPVEEIGRDHDLDWAVIEPSSVSSIVQMAGRVRRHRRQDAVTTPNIAILDRNLSSLQLKDKPFFRPGNELHIAPNESSMEVLLKGAPGYDDSQGHLPINALLKFGFNGQRCAFAEKDDEGFEEKLTAGRAVYLSHQEQGTFRQSQGLFWLAKDHYLEFALREKNRSYRFHVSGDGMRLKRADNLEWVGGLSVAIEDKKLCVWASPTTPEVLDTLKSMGVLKDSLSEQDDFLELELSPPRVDCSIRYSDVFGANIQN